MTQNAATPHARLVVSRGLLLKSSNSFAHSGKHALYGNPPRWHLITPNKPAPKGAPVASHPHAAGAHGPAKHFTDEQWAALKLPEDNVNAGSHNKKIDHIKELSEGGHVTGLLGLGIGSNTYGKKQALVINHLLGLHGSAHKVTAGQKAGEHPAVQSAEPATPHPTGLPEHLAPKTTPDLQEPGPLAPLAQHVKNTIDDKAAEGDVEFIKLVAANNPEHPQIVAYAKQKLAELGGKPATPPATPIATPTTPSLPPGAKLSTDVNASPLVHTTTPEAAAAIQKDGFKLSGNSMYGKGVYFSSAAQSDAYGSAVLGAKLKPHKQLVLAKDSDVSKAFTALTGLSSGHLGSDKGAQAMIDAGVGSMVFPVDDETYTVVFDPGLIDVQAKAPALEATGNASAGTISAVDESKVPDLLTAATGPMSSKAYILAALQDKSKHKFVSMNGDAVVAAISFGVSSGTPDFPGKHVSVKNLGSSKPGEGSKLLNIAIEMAAKMGVPVALKAGSPGAAAFYKKHGFVDGANINMMVLPVANMKVSATTTETTPSPAPAASTGPLAMPAFEEGKTTTGVKAYYEKVAQKVIDHGHAGNAAVLEGMKADGLKPNTKGKTTNTWLGKTANSKKLLALHAAALEHATGGKPSAGAGPKEGDTKPAADGGTLVLKDGHWVKQGGDEPSLAGKPAVEFLGNIATADLMASDLEKQAKKWLAANPGKEADLSNALTEYGFSNVAAEMDLPAPDDGDGFDPFADAPADEMVAQTAGSLTPQQLSNLQSIPWFKLKLPPENTNAKSHNAALAKIEAMAFAGDTAGLQAFIDAKAGAKQTYAKKQVLTAQTALAGLQQPGATAAVPVEPAPAKPSAPPLTGVSADTAIASFKAASPHASLADLEAKWKDANAGKAGLNAEWAMAANPAPAPTPTPAPAPAPSPAAATAAAKTVTAPKTILHNTTPGHSKSWSVYVAPNASGGFDMVTEYGKIGAKQQKTAKSFPTADAAHNAAAALKQEKFGKGYVTQKVDYGHKVTVAGGADAGPKEGDTKQGADGMLVLKDGHWVKMGGTPAAIKKLDLLAVNFILQTLPPSLVPQAKFSVNHASKMALAAAKTGDTAGMAAAYSKAFDLGYEKTGGHIKAVAEAMGVDTSKWGSGSVATSAAAPAPAAKPAANNLPSMDSWIQTGPQGGSNPGGRFKDADGVEWYCKFPPDEGHARSEVLAAKLYEAAGLKSQDAKLVTKGGKVGIASRWVDVKKVGAEGLKDTPGALGGFVVDAWLANWDVVGMGYDNLQVGPDGGAVRVDAGGSLQYRAQGAAKPFGHKVEEIKTMRDPKKNPQAAAVFGALTAADMTASAKKVLSISDDQIHDLVMAHGPGDVAKKAELIDALIARKEDIAKQFPKAVPKEKVKPKPDPTKLKVSADQLPKPHDFKNWKGAGSGLSSKAHVNEANQAAEQALLDAALKGNLIALKDYHFDALDKETGAGVGKKPISEHPSNHVKTYWSDLVSTLSFIAYPPEALKKFKSVVATSIAKVSDAFKAAKYGTTTKGVEANSRLAFWIALGNTKPAESLLPPGASLDFQSSPTGQPKVTPAMTEQAKAAYQALNSGRPVKRFINGIQSSGLYNDNFRDGRMVTTDGWDAAAMALDAYGYAAEKPEGFELYKWISFPGDMGKQMLSAPPGTVFQNPGSMCCSTNATSTSGFGSDRVRIRYAKGAKGVDSFGSTAGQGAFKNEYEITTLPGQRFVILKCHKVMCPVKGKERIELDVLMLPPDPTYVAELEAMKGKHGGKS